MGTVTPGLTHTLTVPANKIWIPIAVYGRIATDATVGNRTIAITMTDGVNEILRLRNLTVVPASQTVRYSFLQGVGDTASITGYAVNALPQIILKEGWTWVTQIVAGGAGDVHSLVNFIYLEADITQP